MARVGEPDRLRPVVSTQDHLELDQVTIPGGQAADRKLVAGVGVFDIFEGPSLGEGRKSVAVEVTIQPAEKTLDDADLETLTKAIVDNVTKQTGAVLRG